MLFWSISPQYLDNETFISSPNPLFHSQLINTTGIYPSIVHLIHHLTRRTRAHYVFNFREYFCLCLPLLQYFSFQSTNLKKTLRISYCYLCHSIFQIQIKLPFSIDSRASLLSHVWNKRQTGTPGNTCSLQSIAKVGKKWKAVRVLWLIPPAWVQTVSECRLNRWWKNPEGVDCFQDYVACETSCVWKNMNRKNMFTTKENS